MDELILQDTEVSQAIIHESQRQINKLELIASENFTSKACREAQGSVLTHKYAEGYPRKRYYGGCTYVDQVEELAINRAKELFQCNFANVQPHSGSQANMAAYFAKIQVGATILSMDLAHGGHLTHGSKVNFSGKLFHVVHYGVDRATGQIDYDALETLAMQCHPAIIVAGASAYPRIIDFARFQAIANKCGALLYVDMAHIAGLVATNLHPSPLPYADVVTTTTHKTLRGPRGGMILTNKAVIAAKAVAFKEALRPNFKVYQTQVVKNAKVLANELVNAGFKLVSDGTDNHLILVDLTTKNLTGQEAELALDLAGITVNKNSIPFDQKSPKITSGIRLGTPALTTRGFKENDIKQTAKFIIQALEHYKDEKFLASLQQEVQEFAQTFPLFSNN